MYEIFFSPEVEKDLEDVPAFKKSEILDKIEDQLKQEPTQPTRKRKFIEGIKPPWSKKEGFWQLRIREYRVFYKVDTDGLEVIVQAIRRKPPHKTTEEIL